MASTHEKLVKQKVVKLLKAQGVYYFSTMTHGFGRSGVPDIICCIDGKFLGIECKAGSNKPTALQEKEMQAIRDAGGRAVVINEHNLTLLGDLLKEMVDEQRSSNLTRENV